MTVQERYTDEEQEQTRNHWSTKSLLKVNPQNYQTKFLRNFNVEDMDDVDMVDVEEGELAGENHRRELGQNSSVDGDLVAQQPQSISLLFYNHSFDEGRSGDVQSIPWLLTFMICNYESYPENSIVFVCMFVFDTCRHLKEKKSYLVWTAVGCLVLPGSISAAKYQLLIYMLILFEYISAVKEVCAIAVPSIVIFKVAFWFSPNGMNLEPSNWPYRVEMRLLEVMVSTILRCDIYPDLR
ncbi:putative phosphorylated adapter RNA export protein, RNA-binding domain-containing protein [Tanacetum coccineum]